MLKMLKDNVKQAIPTKLWVPLLKIKNLIYKLSGAFLYYFYNHCVTNIPVYKIRHLYLKNILQIKISNSASIHMGCFFTGNKISVGDNSVINRNCYLDGREGIQIGANISISPECYILSLSHQVNDEHFSTIGKKVVIEDYCWVGVRGIVLPGVHLSKGCVVGAGSVVTKSFKENQIIAGSPAKIIGQRTGSYDYSIKYFPFFDTDITH